jgi:hypothetical protein
VKPAPNRHARHADDGCDLGRRQAFPAAEPQNLAVLLLETRQGGANSRDAVILRAARTGDGRRQLRPQPIRQARATQLAAALIGELTSARSTRRST